MYGPVELKLRKEGTRNLPSRNLWADKGLWLVFATSQHREQNTR